MAVDLSSRRVRLALHLLDGVRAGQPLGALLGYRLERGLHENHPGLSLDRYIAALRAIAPLDYVTRAEHDLTVALQQQADTNGLLGRARQEVDAASTAADQLGAQVVTAQATLDAARDHAETTASNLRLAKQALRDLNDDPEPDTPGQIAAAMRRIHDLQVALDAANRAVGDAEGSLGALRGQATAADARTAAALQQVTRVQADLDSARTTVAAARAALDEARGREPRQSESLRASNVADGLGLRRRWRTGAAEGRWDPTTIPFGDATVGLPALSSVDGQAINAELRMLDDAVDALGDLLLAESVHQLVHGNPQRAGATVDALSRGDVPPPDVELVRTPRSGTGVTHRLLALVDPGAAAVGWVTDSLQVRARVEPALEAWVAAVLGPATRVRVRVAYAWDGGHAGADMRLAALRLSALDAIAMAPGGASTGPTEIELAMLEHARRVRPAGVPADATARLELARDPGWPATDLGLGEFLELARATRELLDGARAADTSDLGPTGVTAATEADAADLAARAALATDALRGARSRLTATDPAAVPDGLARAAKLGVPSGSVATVLAELDRRAKAAAGAASATARIAAVLGDGFLVLPRLPAGSVAVRDLVAGLGASGELQGGDELAAVTWLQRAAHVRDGAARLETVLMYAEATGAPERLRLRVAQLPQRPGDRWVGLPATPGTAVPGGRTSLVVQGGAATPGAAVAGLVIDEWTEVVPAPTQMTGAGMHVDQPDSRAPQAILLAVPPTEDHLWSLDALEAAVLETFDLARLRLVDAEALAQPSPIPGPRIGHFLPAVYLATAPADDTVTTDLSRVAAADPGTA
jgi:hypothetical protein